MGMTLFESNRLARIKLQRTNTTAYFVAEIFKQRHFPSSLTKRV